MWCCTALYWWWFQSRKTYEKIPCWISTEGSQIERKFDQKNLYVLLVLSEITLFEWMLPWFYFMIEYFGTKESTPLQWNLTIQGPPVNRQTTRTSNIFINALVVLCHTRILKICSTIRLWEKQYQNWN